MRGNSRQAAGIGRATSGSPFSNSIVSKLPNEFSWKAFPLALADKCRSLGPGRRNDLPAAKAARGLGRGRIMGSYFFQLEATISSPNSGSTPFLLAE